MRMTRKTEVELIGDATNAAVIRLPERRFPGLVVQGDSLANLVASAERILRALSDKRVQDASDEASELCELLRGYKRAYEHAVVESGLVLPYPTATDGG